MLQKRSPSHFRIILRKNHIWISELLGIIFVIFIISSLTILGIISFINHRQIKLNKQLIAKSNTGYIELSHDLKELKKKARITKVINEFTRKKLPSSIVSSLTNLVYQNGKTFGYDPLLVLAVIHVESMFDPRALGKYKSGKYSGAFGLMQLKIETAKEVGNALGILIEKKEDLFIPEINIALGVAYLTQQISVFKSLKLGILAYNQGPGTIMNDLKNKRPLSIGYYNKVLKSYFTLKKLSS